MKPGKRARKARVKQLKLKHLKESQLFTEKWLFVVTALFALLILALVIGANTGHLPDLIDRIYRLPRGDKFGHLILFGILSFLLNKSALAFFPEQNPVRLVLTVTLLLSIVVGLEEWSQALFPGRLPSIKDLIASYMGVFPAAFLAYWTRR